MLRIGDSVAAYPLSAIRNAAITQKVHRIGDGFLLCERVTENLLSLNVANVVVMLVTFSSPADRQPVR
jgi:hypothetical protein